MFSVFKIILLTIAVALGGCAATVTKPAGPSTAPVVSGQKAVKPTNVALLITGSPKVQASSDWRAFQGEWRSAFKQAAADASIPSTYLEGESGEQPAGTVLVRVLVNDYRYLTPGARFGLGIFSGNAYIDADAEFVEFPGRKVIGKQKYTTTSTAWQGVFSAMTDKQVRALSDSMIQDLTRR